MLTDHEIANKIVKIQGCFMKIKELSGSGAIDRLCVMGTDQVVSLGQALAPIEVDTIKQRQIDPTM